MGDTLADLYREAGLSPAWRNTPEANSPPRRPMPRQMRARVPTYADLQRELPRGEAYTPPTNQIAGAGQQVLEMTGLPSVRRSARAFANGDPRTGAEEGALGLLGVAGIAGLVPRGREPVRPMAAAEAPVAPRPEPRLPARASDGSVLPVRPREPFRNSLRGGSDDLAGAARGSLGSDIRRYETKNSVVLISDRPEGFREINWDVAVDDAGALPLRQRADLEREGIDAAIVALVEDASANPGARYYFQPDNPALARRYARMVRDQAARYGYQATEADGVVELIPRANPPPKSSRRHKPLFGAAFSHPRRP